MPSDVVKQAASGLDLAILGPGAVALIAGVLVGIYGIKTLVPLFRKAKAATNSTPEYVTMGEFTAWQAEAHVHRERMMDSLQRIEGDTEKRRTAEIEIFKELADVGKIVAAINATLQTHIKGAT